MHRHSRRILTAAAMVAVTGLARPAAAQYRFVKIAETGDQFQYLWSSSINNNGVVAFPTNLSDGTDGVFKGSGGPLTPIATGLPQFSADMRSHSLSESGMATFMTFVFDPNNADWDTSLTSTVYKGNGGPLTTVGAYLSSPDDSDFTASATINSSGMVAYAFTSYFTVFAQYWTGDGSTTTALTGSDPFLDYANGLPVGEWGLNDINNNGTVVFQGFQKVGTTGNVSITGLFLSKQGKTTFLYDTLFHLPTFNIDIAVFPSINDHGTVAFYKLSLDGSSIVKGDGGQLTTVASSGGEFSSVDEPISINNRGEVAFTGFTSDYHACLSVGDGITTHRILTGGDTLLGKTVAYVYFPSLNDRGQVSVLVGFTDGSQAIVRAAPAHG